MQRALEGRPWTFDRNLLIVVPVEEEGVNPMDVSFEWCPFVVYVNVFYLASKHRLWPNISVYGYEKLTRLCSLTISQDIIEVLQCHQPSDFQAPEHLARVWIQDNQIRDSCIFRDFSTPIKGRSTESMYGKNPSVDSCRNPSRDRGRLDLPSYENLMDTHAGTDGSSPPPTRSFLPRIALIVGLRMLLIALNLHKPTI
ncbi:hypothetical protein Salat_1092500 [Sesamum alatum]|uniref:Uncharacterized protein n=1 Tax=Sesamum alatum TaxID=300844 RepID=A0AAE1YNH5_9LAMI|nr:hypothetical protein Salat_1092500 [Sesamum alatum]